MTPVTILYVEDSDDLRDTIGMLLEGPGREIRSCATAEQALALLAQEEADLLITDVSLPGMSGTDLARRLLADAPGRRIVLCSGYEFGEAVRQFGPNVHALLKPFEPDDMEHLVTRICDQVRGATA